MRLLRHEKEARHRAEEEAARLRSKLDEEASPIRRSNDETRRLKSRLMEVEAEARTLKMENEYMKTQMATGDVVVEGEVVRGLFDQVTSVVMRLMNHAGPMVDDEEEEGGGMVDMGETMTQVEVRRYHRLMDHIQR